MDLWDYLFDNEYYQRADIKSLQKESRIWKQAQQRNQLQATDQQKRIDELEDQVGQLALLCRSLLTVLREDGTVKPDRLCEVMNRIDAEDGTLDGKMTAPKSSPPDDQTAAPKIQTW